MQTLIFIILVAVMSAGCKKGGSIPTPEEIIAAIPTPTPTPVPTPTPLPAYITVVSSNLIPDNSVSAGSYLNVSTLQDTTEFKYSLFASPSTFYSGATQAQVSSSCGASANQYASTSLNEAYGNNQYLYEISSSGDLMLYSRANASTCFVTSRFTIGLVPIWEVVSAEGGVLVYNGSNYSIQNGAGWSVGGTTIYSAATDGKNFYVANSSGVVSCIHNPNTATACSAVSVTLGSQSEQVVGLVGTDIITLRATTKELKSYPLAGGASTLIYTLTEIPEVFTSNVSMRINTKELYINAAPTLYKVTW